MLFRREAMAGQCDALQVFAARFIGFARRVWQFLPIRWGLPVFTTSFSTALVAKGFPFFFRHDQYCTLGRLSTTRPSSSFDSLSLFLFIYFLPSILFRFFCYFFLLIFAQLLHSPLLVQIYILRRLFHFLFPLFRDICSVVALVLPHVRWTAESGSRGRSDIVGRRTACRLFQLLDDVRRSDFGGETDGLHF